MKTTSIRVRPVIRHIVTRHESDPQAGSGSSGVLAEFDHESYAEEVAQAMRDKTAPRVYAIVEETIGDVSARVWYAYSEEEALGNLASKEAETGKTFRIYSRIKEQMLG